MSDALPPGWETVERALAGAESELASLRRLLERCDEAEAESFVEAVDGSPYSVRDWTEALAFFDQWLAEREVEARPFAAMCGYLHCCTLMHPDTLASPSLKVALSETLTEFGFDAAKDCQI